MTKALRPVIRVDDDKCVNCHTCISVCPVKFCIDGSGDKVKLREELCIGCGSCIAACTHGARSGIDDFDAFLEAVQRKEPLVALAAPAIAARYPEHYLRLNGWLASLGVEAVFDVAFGAELTVESYLRHIKDKKPALVISQPCPAIVSYIELYQPELLPYLAPAHSPMLHALVMMREFYPAYRNRKVVVISPCVAKRREFDEAGLGDYNVTLERISAYLEEKKIKLSSYPELPFTGPPAERAVLFSSPGGLKETVEREKPALASAIRKMEGPLSIYPYLRELPASVAAGVNPLILDCLNCEKGCNGGTGTGLADKPIDLLEAAVRARNIRHIENLGGKAASPQRAAKRIRKLISTHWKPSLYGRGYVDRSALARLKKPSEVELAGIYKRMRKVKEEDFLNCSACGYGNCEDMAIAIHNGLNKADNCQHYRLLVLEESKGRVAGMSIDLDAEIARAAELLDSLLGMLPELKDRTAEQATSLEDATARISGLIAALESSSGLSVKRKAELEELRAAAARVQSELGSSLSAVIALKDQMSGITSLVGDINKIASQTNLLSMNAAIEAAHAGDSGRGFAVVASEIRGLADQAGKSASQIGKTLADMVRDMAATAAATAKSGSSIRGVLGDLEESAEGMGEIFASLSSMSAETGGVDRALRSLSSAATSVRETYRRMETALKTTTDEIGAIARISRENVSRMEGL